MTSDLPTYVEGKFSIMAAVYNTKTCKSVLCVVYSYMPIKILSFLLFCVEI